MQTYAGIGSRGLSPDEVAECRKLGREYAAKGWLLRTGAARGADQAFADGALDSTLGESGGVILCLPWWGYEEHWVESAQTRGATVRILNPGDTDAYMSVVNYHPAPDRLSEGARKLHARNYLIMEGCNLVIAYPKLNKYGQKGGTEQVLRIARDRGILIRDLSE